MKYKKIMASIMTVIILLFTIVFFVKKDVNFSENENRYLSKFPKFNFNDLINDKYISKLEDYFKDQFPNRDFFIRVNSMTNVISLKKEINGVYIGKDNYLIEKYDTPANYDKVISVLNDFYNNNSDINFNLMIVPTSIEINKDKLPKYVDSNNEYENIKYIYSNINFDYIDVYDTLLEHNSKYQMFYYLDHHWTTYGAYYGYVEYAKKMGFTPYDMNRFNITEVTNNFNGTLYSKTGIYNRDSDSIYVFDYPNDITVNYVDTGVISDTMYDYSYLDKKDKYSLFLDNNHSLIVIDNNDNIDTDKEIIVIKDSYANSLVPFLVNHYKKVHIIDPRYYNMTISDYINDNPNIKNGLILYHASVIDTDVGIMGIE